MKKYNRDQTQTNLPKLATADRDSITGSIDGDLPPRYARLPHHKSKQIGSFNEKITALGD